MEIGLKLLSEGSDTPALSRAEPECNLSALADGGLERCGN
jgi:hypothetical protein